MKFGTAFNKEFLELRRTRKFFVALVVIVLFGMTSPLMAKMVPEIMKMVPGGEQYAFIIPPPTINDAITQYVKNVTQFGVLLVLLFGMGSVAGEKDKGTAAMLFSKPLPRLSFLLAKISALTFVFALPIVISGAAGYYYTYVLFGQLPLLPWLGLNGLIMLYLLMYIALTVFFSTLTKTQYIAIGLSFGTLMVFGILSSLPGLSGYFPDVLITNAAMIASGIKPESWIGVWTSLGILCASIVGGWLIFRKQEL
jgi:ABC-2 type transport system permease protein